MGYQMCYHTFSIRLEWFWSICNAFPRVIVKLIKNIYNKICVENITVTRGDSFQIAQNQEHLRKNIQ